MGELQFDGNAIRQLRGKMSVPVFIAEVGLDIKSNFTIHNWEENRSEPNPTQLAKIAQHFNKELIFFFKAV